MQKNKLLVSFSVTYLSLPLVFFAYGWVRQPISLFMVAVTCTCFIFVFLDLQNVISSGYLRELFTRNKPFIGKFGVAFVTLALWLFFSGVGGFGYQTMDYLHHNALFKELIDSSWPLMINWKEGTAPVVYYLGWYLPAAFTGKLLGWDFANVFILFWAFVGVMLAFGWFLNLCNVRNLSIKKLVVFLLVFCLGGGLDFFGYFFLRGHTFDIRNVFPVDGWTFLQFSSNTTLIYWVPQHAIPAWLLTGLIVECISGDRSNIKYLGIGLAGCLMSSPFGVIGTLPYILLLLMVIWQERHWRELFTWQSVFLNALSIPVAVIGFLYLTSNMFSFPAGFIWKFTDSPLVFVGWLEFFLVEIGFLTIAIFAGFWSGNSRSASYGKLQPAQKNSFTEYLSTRYAITGLQFGFFVVSVMILFFLPAYKMGFADDFVMRASIPSLFIFWSFVGKVLTESGFKRNVKTYLPYAMVVALVVIGFYNSLAQISTSIRNYHFGPPNKADVLTVATGSLPWVVEQRLGNPDTIFYKYLGK